MPLAKNIYGVTKLAAEGLCELFQRNQGLPCIVLRTSRFFPGGRRPCGRHATRIDDANLKANEFLYRRVDLEDVVDAHLAGDRPRAGDRLRPLHHQRDHAVHPRRPAGVAPRCTGVVAPRARLRRPSTRAAAGACSPGIERVYDNARAREELGWRPRHDFASVIERSRVTGDIRSALARAIGAKGYHAEVFADGAVSPTVAPGDPSVAGATADTVARGNAAPGPPVAPGRMPMIPRRAIYGVSAPEPVDHRAEQQRHRAGDQVLDAGARQQRDRQHGRGDRDQRPAGQVAARRRGRHGVGAAPAPTTEVPM